MERIQLYKVKKLNIRFHVIFSIFAFLYGLVGTTINLLKGFDMSFPGGDWLFPIFIVQGIVFLMVAYQQWYKGKYFIALDNQYLSYQLLRKKRTERIAVSDINQISMDGIEVQILTKEGSRVLRFEYIEWQELNRVKALIKDLQQTIEN